MTAGPGTSAVDRSALMHNYADPAVTFVRGEGSTLYDTEGRAYLDFLSGLAVTSLGHAHPAVADAVAELALRLPRSGPATFRQLTGHLTSRIEIIVRFLALLELCKQGRVSLDQGHTFGDLSVEWVPGAPETVSVGIGPADEYEG